MIKKKLGKTGLSVTEVGLGTWPIGNVAYGRVSRSQASLVVESYLESGGNFIDTARLYGISEHIIGQVLLHHGLRDKVVLATKTANTHSLDVLADIRRDLEESLRLLKTDVIDLYYIHNPPVDSDLMYRVLDEFQKLKTEGKIRSIGASIKGGKVTEATCALCRQYVDTGEVDVVLLIYSILRQLNIRSIKYAFEHNVGVVARTVLESGFLTGKYFPGKKFSKGDFRNRWKRHHLDSILDEVQKLKKWAVKPPYRSLSQVAIRFALEPKAVCAVIMGAKNKKQALNNLSVTLLPPLEKNVLFSLRNKYKSFTSRVNVA